MNLAKDVLAASPEDADSNTTYTLISTLATMASTSGTKLVRGAQ